MMPSNDDMTFVVDDSTSTDVTHAYARGYVERDWSITPSTTFKALPPEIKIIPEGEWLDYHRANQKTRSGLRFLRQTGANGSRIPSLNQNPQGFCWAYSEGGALMYARLRAAQPYVRLSPHAVACKIMNFQDRGGWAGLSAQFARGQHPQHPGIGGYPSEEFWPQRSMSRQYDNAATWADAKKHMAVTDYADLALPVYSQNLTFQQVMSCLLQGIPLAADFNWWGHSVLLFDTDEKDGRVWPRGLNSWGDEWGELGEFTLMGSKAYPNGAIATLLTTPG